MGILHVLKTPAALKNFIDSNSNSSESEQSFNSEKTHRLVIRIHITGAISIHFTGQGPYSRKINQL